MEIRIEWETPDIGDETIERMRAVLLRSDAVTRAVLAQATLTEDGHPVDTSRQLFFAVAMDDAAAVDEEWKRVAFELMEIPKDARKGLSVNGPVMPLESWEKEVKAIRLIDRPHVAADDDVLDDEPLDLPFERSPLQFAPPRFAFTEDEATALGESVARYGVLRVYLVCHRFRPTARGEEGVDALRDVLYLELAELPQSDEDAGAIEWSIGRSIRFPARGVILWQWAGPEDLAAIRSVGALIWERESSA